jgi:flagellar biosynthetic protein FliQ
MDPFIASALRDCIITIAKIGGPVLLAAMIIGVIISMLQAVTQINDATLAFLPKMIIIFLTILLFGPYFVRVMSEFSQNLFDHIVTIGGS